MLRTSCSTIPCASKPSIDGWNKASPTVYLSFPIFITWHCIQGYRSKLQIKCKAYMCNSKSISKLVHSELT
uniref:Uncharacterized protein MANES_10G141100 n=1 Tax=Rhizophora mucronata TaxID=61149 RepID=A0A2P2JDJ6_RHIMU